MEGSPSHPQEARPARRWDQAAAVALVAGGLALGAFALLKGGRSGVRVGSELGPVAYRDARGAKHTLAELRGKLVLVDVWATWCPPCRSSLPELRALQEKAGADYAVVPLSVDEGGPLEVEAFFQAHPELRVDAAVPEGPSTLMALGGVQAYPTTFLVGRDGRLLKRWVGYAPGRSEAELKAALAGPGR